MWEAAGICEDPKTLSKDFTFHYDTLYFPLTTQAKAVNVSIEVYHSNDSSLTSITTFVFPRAFGAIL